MKYLSYRWQPRTLILLAISIVISLLLISLELTEWAQHVNQTGYSHGDGEDKRNIPVFIMYILPFVKEIVLIGVPLLLTLIYLKIVDNVKRAFKK